MFCLYEYGPKPKEPLRTSQSLPSAVDEVSSRSHSFGKSSLAIEVAKSINGEILSLDSIAVYRKMDIGLASRVC